MDMPVYIVINPHCHQGQGWKRWLSIRETILERFPGAEVVVTATAGELKSHASSWLETGQPATIISAGGDGSVNALVNLLIKSGHAAAQNFVVGAIGLGSSNDFLKPFKETIQHVPVRITGPAAYYDAGLARFTDNMHHPTDRYFIVNASIGLTAAANWAFNQPDPVLKILKRYSTDTAILYTAARTLWNHRNTNCHVLYDQVDEMISISNVNILKNPNVSGSFRYPQDIRPDDGVFGINIAHDMDRMELLSMVAGLAKGKFIPGEKKISLTGNSFYLRSASPVVLECDGETMLANDIHITLVPKAIQILS